MKAPGLLVIFVVMLALVLCSAAGAQALCAPTPDLLAALKARHGEEPVWTGKAGESRMILTQSPEGGWSLIRLMAEGETACLVGAGTEAADPRGREI